MVNVIGVRFPNAGKLYYFSPGEFWPTPGDYVLVETMHGLSLGEVVMPVNEIDENTLRSPLKPVIRIASQEDLRKNQENRELEKSAHEIALEKIKVHQLPMKLVGTEYTFDRAKVIFYFTADGRVDFRALVRDLSSALRPRVELRQIGVRDEARMMGGLGPCGRPICCSGFLGDFQPVSIKMAKSQNLSMNPAKISGICGKLMCCIKFEEETYEQIIREMPHVNARVNTPDGPGTVTNLYVAREMVRVRISRGDTGELRDYPLDVLKELNPQMTERRASRPDKAEGPEQDESRNGDVCKSCRRAARARKEALENPVEAEADTAEGSPAEDVSAGEAPAAEPEAAESAPAKEEVSGAASWRSKLAEAMKAAESRGAST
ncbi:MAG: stage 0 sporulation family protein [Clostridia bacterium]|nr:stage 0 sporulation family protein [Clostridia bacterium]